MNNQLLDVLTHEGVLINVSVHYWRATKKLNPEDLGLDPDNITERFISLGHKKLLPKDKLESFALIESRAHALVNASTFPFLNGLSRFLPNTKLAETTTRLSDLQREFREAKQRFLDHYIELRAEACGDWFQAAGRLVKDPERVVANIEASFPNPVKMEQSFGFGVQLFHLRVPEKLDAALVSLADHQEILQAREQAARQAGEQIQQGVQQFVSDCVASLRQQTAQLCEEMLQSIQSNKTGVHQKTLNRLVRFIDQFKQLNFVGDQEMEIQLDRVRQEFLQRTAEDYRENGEARAGLQQGLQALADTARQLATQDNQEIVQRFGSLGHRRLHLAA